MIGQFDIKQSLEVVSLCDRCGAVIRSDDSCPWYAALRLFMSSVVTVSCVCLQVIKEPRPRSNRWVSSSIPQANWDTELARYSSAEYHVNNLVSPVLFQEALEHIPSNAVVVEIAPHSLLQAVLRRGLASTCSIFGLMDKRQPDNLVHMLSTLGK